MAGAGCESTAFGPYERCSDPSSPVSSRASELSVGDSWASPCASRSSSVPDETVDDRFQAPATTPKPWALQVRLDRSLVEVDEGVAAVAAVELAGKEHAG